MGAITGYVTEPEDVEHANWLLRDKGLQLGDMPDSFLNWVTELNHTDNYHARLRAMVTIDYQIAHPLSKRQKKSRVARDLAAAKRQVEKALSRYEAVTDDYVREEDPGWITPTFNHAQAAFEQLQIAFDAIAKSK